MLNPARPFLIALRERNLRLLFGGLVASQAGDWLYNLALLAFVYERTGSTAWVGLTTAARVLPEVVLGPLGGVLRAASSGRPRRALIAAATAIGVPLLALTFSGSVAAALVLAASIGAGQFVTEVVSDTTLQRSLDPAVFARAYGLVVPAAVAGIAGGALLAAPCVALIGLDGTLALVGALVLAYGLLAFARPQPAPLLDSVSA